MGALSKIRAAGFDVELRSNGNIGIKPVGELSEIQREFLRLHKAEIVDELETEQGNVYRQWLISLSDGETFMESHTPPSTLAEVRRAFPDAVKLTPIVPSANDLHDEFGDQMKFEVLDVKIRRACRAAGRSYEDAVQLSDDCREYSPSLWSKLWDHFDAIEKAHQDKE